MSAPKGPDRRKRTKKRRLTTQERRNDDRVADEFLPRRNPELPDRRGETNS